MGRTTSWRKNRKEGIPSIRRLWAQNLRLRRDTVTSIHGVELSLGGAIDGLAIYGADVYAGHKCESYASDGTFCEANVGGDNDEKYEDDDFSISEVLPAPCDSDRIVGMCFQNVNVERVFLYYHYEFVKRDFG